MKTPYDVIIRPIITESATMMTAEKKYVFEVISSANKTEVKNAFEEIFDVDVENVNTMIVKGKVKRQGRNVGRRRSWKKAIIKLTPESKDIDLFDDMR